VFGQIAFVIGIRGRQCVHLAARPIVSQLIGIRQSVEHLLDLLLLFSVFGKLVVGTGGDNLEGVPKASVTGADIDGLKAFNAVTYSRFGYMVGDRVDATTWSGTFFDVNAKPLNRCRLGDRLLSCGS
jgi:hypothetical protein